MAEKDYYKILGVSRQASAEGIRNAFRKLAKKYHPDKAGPGGKDQFQDVMEAYEVLSDPEKRSSYDKRLKEQEQGFTFRGRSPVFDSSPFFSRRWPFDPWPTRSPLGQRFTHPQPDLILVLSQEEAEKGGTIDVEVPYYTSCPECGGSGESWFFPCVTCLGEGLIKEKRKVRIRIPAMVEDGSVIEVPLQRIGVMKRFLRVLVEIH
ncbi:MAG: J domain-containing protein [Deltaproteobacteria bacterium]|nr:J domain-containing protein [Deltaproteobacteria bacterium]MBW1928128.1 J domain-containing protein [Deltaproteobacteria bacterium]MBW2025677.1 J domain-containing protein [Deltaproteobacteria bacterium]MBW2127307.1 J domain-containing protein [Deltaproteobacteria bacterium]RLB23223.1 MAG: hypothetical protein DRG76_04750 [Deltaproteobacteria bacterium]